MNKIRKFISKVFRDEDAAEWDALIEKEIKKARLDKIKLNANMDSKEQQLQKRLNEICGTIQQYPEYGVTEDGGRIPLGMNVVLLPISLELILTALQNRFSKRPDRLSVEYVCKNDLILLWDDTGGNKSRDSIEYELLKPFSLQPTETQEALFKIFEIE